jgi:predicted dehydrogenase
MRFLVTGCGSIGRRHIKNLLSIGNIEVISHDIFPDGRNKVKELFGIKTYENYDDALADSPDAVIVATPTKEHIKPALKAAKTGCHLFIEKPVSHELEGLNEVLSTVKDKNLITLVGCNMRFHPGLKKVKELLEVGAIGKLLSADIETGSYMPEWRPGTDYRKIYSSKKDMGGGVILDAIHEIDYARWMLGDVAVVSCMADKQSSLEIDVEDVADMLLRFTSGVIAHVHLDYVQRAYSRNCKFVGEDGIISWDFNDKKVGLFSGNNKQWSWFKQPENFELNHMYIDEIKHFINCVKGIEKPTLDLFEGVEDLKISLAAKQSSTEKRYISLV